MRIVIFTLLVLIILQKGFGTTNICDTIPGISVSERISRDVLYVLKGKDSAANLALFFTREQFNQNQIDSLLLALNEDRVVHLGLLVLIGHWHLNSEHIHERLCSFIELDTTDYEGRWGENRRMSNRSREIGARLALAKLGYQYHIDFIEGIFREQDISNYRMATLLTDFTLYLSNDQILNALFDLALTSQHYRYIEHDNHTFEWVQYYLLTYVFHSLHRHLTYNETVVYKNLEEYTWDDYLMLSKWVETNRHKPNLLKEYQYSAQRIGGMEVILMPKTPKKKATSPPVYSPDRPHLRHQGLCYFDGDTIRVKKPDSGNKVRLMAYRNSRQLMGNALEWQGVDEIEPYHYGVLSVDNIKRDGSARKVKAICRGCGENDTDVAVEVTIEIQE
jgi:hypothetical protein